MTSINKISTYFDRKAASFDAIYSGEKNQLSRLWDTLTRKNIYSRLDFTMRSLSPLTDRKILDVGCGSGRYCIEIARAGAKEVVGIDVSPKMLEIARQLAEDNDVLSRCRFVQMNILDLNDSFDDAVAMGFFDYVQEPERVFAHLKTLIKGKLIASFPAITAPRAPFRKGWLTLQGCPVFFYSRSEIELLCQRNGFVCNTLIKRGPIYLLVAEPNSKSAGQM